MAANTGNNGLEDPQQVGVSNGFEKHVSFEEQQQGSGGPGEGQEYGNGGGAGFYSSRGSSGDMSGFVPDHSGFYDSGQVEYTGDSEEDEDEEEEGEENLVDVGAEDSQQVYQEGDNAYFKQTGQPLIPSDDNFKGNNSSQYNHGDRTSSPTPLEDFQDSSEYSREAINQNYYQEYDEDVNPESEEPFVPEPFSPARARRSLTPERSLSPMDNSSQAISAMSPDADSEPSESLASEAETYHQNFPSNIPRHRAPEAQTPSPMMSPRPARSCLPRPQASPRLPRAKKPLELPPWDDNVVIPKPPRPKSTMIGKQPDLPPRPRTAPTPYHRKGGVCLALLA